jgi:hypothetical protein
VGQRRARQGRATRGLNSRRSGLARPPHLFLAQALLPRVTRRSALMSGYALITDSIRLQALASAKPDLRRASRFDRAHLVAAPDEGAAEPAIEPNCRQQQIAERPGERRADAQPLSSPGFGDSSCVTAPRRNSIFSL